jgi:predicted porin
MKKMLMAAALAAVVTVAGAQSNVSLYGIVDLGLVSEHGGANGTLTKLTSGIGSVSRFGLRGVEDLGGGLSAIFTLESGVKADTGEQDSAGVLFQRQAWMGLRSTTWGTLTLGRQYTPFYKVFADVADPFATSYAGTARNLFPVSGATTRASNTVKYATPNLRGWSAEAAYTFGEQAGSSTAGRQTGFAAGYEQGPLVVRLGRLDRNSDVAGGAQHDSGSNTILAANYDFKIVKAYAAYERDKGYGVGTLANTSNPYGGVAPTPSTDARELLIGFTMPLGRGSVIASHIDKDDRSSYNQDARQDAIGYVYPLSARTSVYTAYAKIHNKNGAGYTVGNNAEAGSGDSAVNLGVRHTF